jgi:hypothetical protein
MLIEAAGWVVFVNPGHFYDTRSRGSEGAVFIGEFSLSL